MNTVRRFKGSRIIALLLILLMSSALLVSPTTAQGNMLAVGENKQGEVTAAATQSIFTLSANASQVVVLQVLGLTPGFAPSFSVTSSSGVAIATVPNLAQSTIVQSDVFLPSAGLYQVIVTSANLTPGQFVVSAQAGAPVAPPTPILPGQSVTGSVDPQTILFSYSFSSSLSDVLHIRAQSQDGASAGPIISLKDATSNVTLATTSADLIGADYRLPVGTRGYLLQVAYSGAPGTQPFTVCLETESAVARCPGSPSQPVVQLPTLAPNQPPPPTLVPPTPFIPVPIAANGPCAVASLSGVNVNIRSAPTTGSAIVGGLPNNVVALVTGKLADNSWYLVNANGLVGWISGSVVVVGGLCNTVPVTAPTPANVTVIPGATATPTATNTPTPTATNTPLVLVTVPPIIIPNITLVLPIPTVGPTLNLGLPATYGDVALTSGFSPDPYSRGLTSGGIVNVNYLGASCRGYAAVAPDLQLTYTSGGFSLLRFYVVSSSDTTLIINPAGGGYFCADDTYGQNPAIDFTNPSSGAYDIWVGSFQQGGGAASTLFITELASNTP